jgi:hypothetical protein
MILSSLVIVQSSAGLNPVYDSHPLWTDGSGALAIAPRVGVGAMMNTQPVDENPRSAGGYSFAMFAGDYYDRIQVTPSSVDVGNLLDTFQTTINVWNAFRRGMHLDAIAITGGQGVNLTGGVQPPAQFAALQSSNYTLAVTLDGPPGITNEISFQFTGASAVLTITGKRLVLFSVSPDWSEKVTEGYGYLTDIFTAYDDTEQRVQLRGSPARTLAFKPLVLEARDAAAMDALLFGWQHRVFGVPWWQDAQQLASNVIVGSKSIPVPTSLRGFEVGGIVLLWVDQHTWEVQQIHAMDATTITTENPLLKTWSANKTFVIPVKIGRMTNSETIDVRAPGVAEMSLKFTIEATL